MKVNLPKRKFNVGDIVTCGNDPILYTIDSYKLTSDVLDINNQTTATLHYIYNLKTYNNDKCYDIYENKLKLITTQTLTEFEKGFLLLLETMFNVEIEYIEKIKNPFHSDLYFIRITFTKYGTSDTPLFESSKLFTGISEDIRCSRSILNLSKNISECKK